MRIIAEFNRISVRSAQEMNRRYASEFDEKFVYVRDLGSGTFGRVFEAKHKIDNGNYAIKQISVDTRSGQAERTLREVKALALFDHPHIVKYNNSWIEESPLGGASLYIQMEICQSTLETWLSNNDQRDLRTIKLWMVQIVSAVAYIHAMGKIHRDLKPTNILFVSDNQLKLCDLGIVTDAVITYGDGSHLGEENDGRTYAQGTPLYMAPEQKGSIFGPNEYTHKVDVFTIGLIFAELCVQMSEKDKIFDNYRKGTKDRIETIALNERLKRLGMLEFIDWLTSVDDKNRPECNEILKHGILDEHNMISTFGTKVTSSILSTTGHRSTNYTVLRRRIRGKSGHYESEFLQKFEPQSILGEGGYGQVFKARNILDECIYAVKRIAVRERNLERDFTEVRAFASLPHENIVSYKSCWIEKPPVGWQRDYDSILRSMGLHEIHVSYPEDCVFIYCQMELCACSLGEWLRENHTRDLSQAKLWFKQIVSAIGFIHNMNKIHRDVKPGNILFDKYGRIKVCDLGILTERVMCEGETEDEDITRTMVGTRLYMAPEQNPYIDSFFPTTQRYSSKVDIFSLGLVFVEMCIVMTFDESIEILDNYREGLQHDGLDHIPEVKNFITWLTHVNPKERPSCEEILKHPFILYYLEDVENGTIFYHEYRGEEGKHRLYVEWNWKDYEADLLDEVLLNIGTFGNALYYCTGARVIRRAIFSTDRGIAISSIRSLEKDELIELDGICSRTINERKFVYRICDDPNSDGIPIDLDNKQLKGMTLRGIHGRKAIFTKFVKSRKVPVAYAMTDNVIVIEIAKRFDITSSAYAPKDHSPFIYLPMNGFQYALNTTTLRFLPPMALGSHLLNPRSIAVHENNFIQDIVARYKNSKVPYASRFVSEFSIKGTVGTGAFGIVFKAKHNFDKLEYAIKCISLNSSTSRDEIWKTLGEVRMLSKLQHPGIVRYHATWMEQPPDGWKYPSSHRIEDPIFSMQNNFGGATRFLVFIQMELCKESLENWLDRHMESRDQKHMRDWFKQIIEAPEHIHSLGIIHRDMKPKNILITSDEIVKICDLGIATEDGNRETWRTNIGTELYKAPEQNMVYDKRVDIFSVGLILLEMCVILSETQKIELFNEIRSGIVLNILQDQPPTLDLITRLIKLNRNERPTLDEILSHPYFTN